MVAVRVLVCVCVFVSAAAPDMGCGGLTPLNPLTIKRTGQEWRNNFCEIFQIPIVYTVKICQPYFQTASASPDPLPGPRPWTAVGDFRLPDSGAVASQIKTPVPATVGVCACE